LQKPTWFPTLVNQKKLQKPTCTKSSTCH